MNFNWKKIIHSLYSQLDASSNSIWEKNILYNICACALKIFQANNLIIHSKILISMISWWWTECIDYESSLREQFVANWGYSSEMEHSPRSSPPNRRSACTFGCTEIWVARERVEKFFCSIHLMLVKNINHCSGSQEVLTGGATRGSKMRSQLADLNSLTGGKNAAFKCVLKIDQKWWWWWWGWWWWLQLIAIKISSDRISLCEYMVANDLIDDPQ